MIDDILQAVKAALQADERLAAVGSYRVADVIVPDTMASVSIFCRRLWHLDYNAAQDKAAAMVRIKAYQIHPDPEAGEQTVRQLASDIRYALLANPYLEGLADAATIIRTVFKQQTVNETETLYIASMHYRVDYFEPRLRPPAAVPPALDTVEPKFRQIASNEIQTWEDLL
ncbi:hypothetical protein SD70_32190 [Gordoniibacillus kamchatkensis]|uniref:Uncharacterized protein n=1 Tax=Gordoniibacillus kamchatkensis TaxID=1590651 RepID=A0ABR5A3C2_9BACL|nr:hypothetical protein [Paenibacillus sp. VKM B-2647]KIL35524.1 hypothetical protein SD70_32190 [Paenibacillus sp. VKM B-2647]